MHISMAIRGWLKHPLASVGSRDPMLALGMGWFRAGGELKSLEQRSASVRYYLGRGRIARDAGAYEAGAREAERAIALNPGNPWAHALLGQCKTRQRRPDLEGARRALERACALDPSNGYFVGLLLDVLDAQGDARAREDALVWSWWKGAPVERWLPEGPPRRAGDASPSASRVATERVPTERVPAERVATGRVAVPA